MTIIDTKISIAGCRTAIEMAGVKCNEDYGPEWENGGTSACNAPGTSLPIYAQMTCNKTKYTAGPYDCCTGNSAGWNPRKTCDPKYRVSPNAAACIPSMITYCSKDNIFSNSRCVAWSAAQPSSAKPIQLKYALAHLDVPAAQAFCNKTGLCDAEATKWCADPAHSTADFCSCINSKVTKDPKYGINPACVDAVCVKSGYMTSNMRNVACPDITNCDVATYLTNSGTMLNTTINIDQVCGAPKPPPPATPSAPEASSASSGGTTSSTTIPVAPQGKTTIKKSGGEPTKVKTVPSVAPAPSTGIMSYIDAIVEQLTPIVIFFIVFVALIVTLIIHFVRTKKTVWHKDNTQANNGAASLSATNQNAPLNVFKDESKDTSKDTSKETYSSRAPVRPKVETAPVRMPNQYEQSSYSQPVAAE